MMSLALLLVKLTDFQESVTHDLGESLVFPDIKMLIRST